MFENPSKQHEFVTASAFVSDCDLCMRLDTLSSHSVSGDSHEPMNSAQHPTRFLILSSRGMTPLLIPEGPDAQFSMSVVIVIVFASTNTS